MEGEGGRLEREVRRLRRGGGRSKMVVELMRGGGVEGGWKQRQCRW